MTPIAPNIRKVTLVLNPSAAKKLEKSNPEVFQQPRVSEVLSEIEQRRDRLGICLVGLIALVGSALGVVGPLLAKPIQQFNAGDWIGLTGFVLTTLAASLNLIVVILEVKQLHHQASEFQSLVRSVSVNGDSEFGSIPMQGTSLRRHTAP